LLRVDAALAQGLHDTSGLQAGFGQVRRDKTTAYFCHQSQGRQGSAPEPVERQQLAGLQPFDIDYLQGVARFQGDKRQTATGNPIALNRGLSGK
jgi:hypothetical protein